MDEDVLYVISTASRDKVAHTHTYPIGAEALSKAFADVPQVREFQLAFSAGRFFNFTGPWAHRSNDAGHAVCTVLKVSYRRRGASLGAQWEYGMRPGDVEAKWRIDVYPVFRNVKHMVRESLNKTLPNVREWLLQHSSADAKLGDLELILTYNETENTMTSSVRNHLEPSRTT